MKSTKIYRQLSACHNKWQHLASNVPSVVSASRSATSKTLSKHTITSQIRSFTSAGSRSAGIEVQGKESRGAVKTKDKSEKPDRKVVFSAIQPTGIPHLGNYLGALSQWKRLQDEAIKDPNIKLYFSVVDLHALTVPGPKEALVASKKQTLAALLAIGLDPEHCALFYQSRIKQIANLYWILGCTSSMGYLSRMTQWKVSSQFLGS
jgi:Tryptophanyl-tRNA synthetase